MNTEMVLVGVILFSAMIAGGIKIWLIKRKEEKVDEIDSDVSHDSTV
jgi:outer membrane murein-binding lipoprotein Lpp